MKPSLALFDVAMFKLSNDIKNIDFHQMREYDPLCVDSHM